MPDGFGLRGVGAIKSDLSTWKAVNFDEYAFGVERGADQTTLAHDAWTFVHKDRRYVVPALVLMRAIVQNDADLLKKLFQAQSLEDICCPVTSDVKSVERIVVSSRLKRASKRKTPGLSALLSWLYSFPSARRCWASAYLSAKQGRIGLTLPAAALTFSLYGAHFRTSGNVYVTQLSLVDVEANEEPLPFASEHPRQISVRQISSKSEEEWEAQLALASKLEISEDIWQAVEPILARSKGRGPKADNRKRLGCVLQVISAGSTWSEAARIHKCSVGTAADALSRWKQDGRWSEVTRALTQFGISL
ncbi:MAG: hypothetical protein J0L58_02675 [Burkholderiales bacterium]|nr:hypothetical protein [Burkholderiales bacterium]